MKLRNFGVILGNWNLDLESKELHWSEEIYQIFGLPSDVPITYAEYIGRVHGDDLSQLLSITQYAILQNQPYQVEHRILRPDGEVRTLLVTGRMALDSDGSAVGIYGTIQDTTELNSSQEKIYYQAFHDGLTGLANRIAFSEHLANEIHRARRMDQGVGVIFIDMDRFKYVNDTYGHDVGDMLLKEVAKRITRLLGPNAKAARLGGDEFTICVSILNAAEARSKMALLASQLVDTLAVPYELNGLYAYLTCSLGVSLFPFDGTKGPDLLKCADTAMYVAKKSGKNNYHFFEKKADEGVTNKLALEHDLRMAINTDALTVCYQPLVDVANSKVMGCEALVRWNHPERGSISPGEFVPMAEETDLIIALGDWVLGRVCRQIRDWLDRGIDPVKVSLNVSPRQIQRGKLVEKVTAAIASSGIDPRYLQLELTETTLVNNIHQTQDAIEGLKEMGVSISMDDFGTGYSSLSYLTRFQFDTLKIDRSFVMNIQNAEDREIVKTIIALGKTLKYHVVAEGVEDEAQLAFLRENGCQSIQGYLFSKPIDPGEYETFLRDFKL